MVIWISGITASGKTALGEGLKAGLNEMGFNNVIHLDGDVLRKRVDWVHGHSLNDRLAVIPKLVDIILMEQSLGNNVIVSTVSHKKKMRDYAREMISNFHEVCLVCSLSVCEARDYKGFYERAKHASDYVDECFPGVSEQYEVNYSAELIIDTGAEELCDSINKLIKYVERNIAKVS